MADQEIKVKCFFWKGVDGCSRKMNLENENVMGHFHTCCCDQYRYCSAFFWMKQKHGAAVKKLHYLEQAQAFENPVLCPFWDRCKAKFDVSNPNHVRHYAIRCTSEPLKCAQYVEFKERR